MTLVEVMMLLVLLALFSAVFIAYLPSLGNLLSVTKTKGASEEVAMAIRQARQLAITEATDHCVNFPAVNQYQIWRTACGSGTSVEGPVTLSQGAVVTDASQTFAFTPIGVTTAGTVTINITDPSACSVTLTVTAAGGVQLASPPC